MNSLGNSLGENPSERSLTPIRLQTNSPSPNDSAGYSPDLAHPKEPKEISKATSYVFYLALAQNRNLFHELRKRRRSQGGLYCAVCPENPESLFKMLSALGFWELEAPKCNLHAASRNWRSQYSLAIDNPIRLIQIGDYRKNPHYAEMVDFLDRYFPSWKKAPVEMP